VTWARQRFRPLIGQADTVICLNVLEHIEDDATGLANISSALIPGGVAIVLVPQDPGLYGTLDEELGHYRRYSEAELRAKWKPPASPSSRSCTLTASPPGWWFTGASSARSSSRVLLWFFDRLVWLWRRIDRTLPGPR